jgi:hypothetical protein
VIFCVLGRNITQQVNTQDLTLGLLQIVDKGTAKVLAELAHVIALDRGWFGHGWEWPSWLMPFLLVDGEMKKQL